MNSKAHCGLARVELLSIRACPPSPQVGLIAVIPLRAGLLIQASTIFWRDHGRVSYIRPYRIDIHSFYRPRFDGILIMKHAVPRLVFIFTSLYVGYLLATGAVYYATVVCRKMLSLEFPDDPAAIDRITRIRAYLSGTHIFCIDPLYTIDSTGLSPTISKVESQDLSPFPRKSDPLHTAIL